MTVSLKDGARLLGVAVMCGCAVFVCTFFLNFYLDALAVKDEVEESALSLYRAQLLTAKFVCIISGSVLAAVTLVLIVFYVRLYVDAHSKQLGLMKALGYGNGKLALGFWVFGLSVFLGAAIGFGAGYAVCPLIYDQMGGEGLPQIPIRFHAELLACFVVLPTVVFSAFSILSAYLRLRRSALALIRARSEGKPVKAKPRAREIPFLLDLTLTTLKSKKSLLFFIAFASFCFASMLQMSVSMKKYSSISMGAMIFGIGIVLSVTALVLAFTSLVRANERTVSVMKAFGYSFWQCGQCILGGYRIPAYCGFALGTVYQYGLLRLMLDVVFSGVSDDVSVYQFDVAVFLIVLACFAFLFEFAVSGFTVQMRKTSVRKLTAE